MNEGLGLYLDRFRAAKSVRVVEDKNKAFGGDTSDQDATENPSRDEIIVYIGARCVDHTGIEVSAKRSFAVAIQLNSGEYYCQGAN